MTERIRGSVDVERCYRMPGKICYRDLWGYKYIKEKRRKIVKKKQEL